MLKKRVVEPALGAVLLGVAAAAAPLRIPASSDAMCSTDPPVEFTVRRTRGIVHEAEVIVRAKALGVAPAPAEDDVEFSVVEVLKGAGVPDRLTIYGGLDDRDSFQEGPVPYVTFHRWHGGGSCFAMTYRPGAEYLLLLARSPDGGELSPYWAALAPTNEQIRGADDPWVRWVRREIAARAGDDG